MIEVFKTNVTDKGKAKHLIDEIHRCFADYTANFDLDDCDKILRVVSNNGNIASSNLVDWLKVAGCTAEILPDN